MRKHKIIFFVFIAAIAILLVISACHAVSPPEPTAANTTTPSHSVTSSITPSKTVTQTPTQITLPTKTLNPRDFDASTITTITPAEPAQCPNLDTSIEIDIDRLISFNQEDGETKPDGLLMDVFIDYLNQGVPIDSLISAIGQQEDYKKFLLQLQIVDVTGDNIKELIFRNPIGYEVIGCIDQEYKTITKFGSRDDWPTMEIVDANNDNLMDLSVKYSFGSWGSSNYHIYSWDGNTFVRQNPNDCISAGDMNFTVTLEDTDNNGTLEIILYSDDKRFPYYYPDLYPPRTEKMTCMWNGSEYLAVNVENSPPFYRFQALSDASQKRYYGYFDQALELYWQAINDPILQWYTDERNKQEWQRYMDASNNEQNIEPDPTPTPVLIPNPDEYDNLAAYAYFRIIMIHLLQDDVSSAESVYEEMLSKYPVGCKQSLLPESAKIMLDSYKQSEDIHNACTEVLKFYKPRYSEMWKMMDYFYWAGPTSAGSLCPYWEGDYTSY
jgi:hypothetical protein